MLMGLGSIRAPGGVPGASVVAVGAVLLLLLVRIRCFLSWLAAWGLFFVLLFLHRWSALVGWLSVLECALWGFLPLFALLHLFPLFRLFVTRLVLYSPCGFPKLAGRSRSCNDYPHH